jgi:uncharacterized membrane protein
VRPGRATAGDRGDVATLTVWLFDTADGAGHAAGVLDRLQVEDAALVAWESGSRKPRVRALDDVPGALGPGFWGLLFGLVFFVPLLGAAMGAATGALGGALADVGIDDHFINRVRDEVTPGTSALFLLTPGPVVGQLHDALAAGPHPAPIATDLDAGQEAALRAVFGD